MGDELQIPTEIVATGSLYIRGSDPKAPESWSLKLFTLTGSHLSYSDSNGNRKGHISLIGFALKKQSAHDIKCSLAKFAFSLFTSYQPFDIKSSRTSPSSSSISSISANKKMVEHQSTYTPPLYLCATSELDRDTWIQCIQSQINECNKNIYRCVLSSYEIIYAMGMVKRAGNLYGYNEYCLIITNYPRLILVDTETLSVKEQLIWSSDLSYDDISNNNCNAASSRCSSSSRASIVSNKQYSASPLSLPIFTQIDSTHFVITHSSQLLSATNKEIKLKVSKYEKRYHLEYWKYIFTQVIPHQMKPFSTDNNITSSNINSNTDMSMTMPISSRNCMGSNSISSSPVSFKTPTGPSSSSRVVVSNNNSSGSNLLNKSFSQTSFRITSPLTSTKSAVSSGNSGMNNNINNSNTANGSGNSGNSSSSNSNSNGTSTTVIIGVGQGCVIGVAGSLVEDLMKIDWDEVKRRKNKTKDSLAMIAGATTASTTTSDPNKSNNMNRGKSASGDNIDIDVLCSSTNAESIMHIDETNNNNDNNSSSNNVSSNNIVPRSYLNLSDEWLANITTDQYRLSLPYNDINNHYIDNYDEEVDTESVYKQQRQLQQQELKKERADETAVLITNFHQALNSIRTALTTIAATTEGVSLIQQSKDQLKLKINNIISQLNTCLTNGESQGFDRKMLTSCIELLQENIQSIQPLATTVEQQQSLQQQQIVQATTAIMSTSNLHTNATILPHINNNTNSNHTSMAADSVKLHIATNNHNNCNTNNNIDVNCDDESTDDALIIPDTAESLLTEYMNRLTTDDTDEGIVSINNNSNDIAVIAASLNNINNSNRLNDRTTDNISARNVPTVLQSVLFNPTAMNASNNNNNGTYNSVSKSLNVLYHPSAQQSPAQLLSDVSSSLISTAVRTMTANGSNANINNNNNSRTDIATQSFSTLNTPTALPDQLQHSQSQALSQQQQQSQAPKMKITATVTTAAAMIKTKDMLKLDEICVEEEIALALAASASISSSAVEDDGEKVMSSITEESYNYGGKNKKNKLIK